MRSSSFVTQAPQTPSATLSLISQRADDVTTAALLSRTDAQRVSYMVFSFVSVFFLRAHRGLLQEMDDHAAP